MLFLVLEIVLMIVLFLVLYFVLTIVLFLVLKIVLMIVLFSGAQFCAHDCAFSGARDCAHDCAFLVLNFMLMIVLFLVLNFVLMIAIPGFFDAQPAFAKLWPVLLSGKTRQPCAPPQTTESETARVCEACGPRLLVYRPGNPRPKLRSINFSPTSGLRPACPKP